MKKNHPSRTDEEIYTSYLDGGDKVDMRFLAAAGEDVSFHRVAGCDAQFPVVVRSCGLALLHANTPDVAARWPSRKRIKWSSPAGSSLRPMFIVQRITQASWSQGAPNQLLHRNAKNKKIVE